MMSGMQEPIYISMENAQGDEIATFHVWQVPNVGETLFVEKHGDITSPTEYARYRILSRDWQVRILSRHSVQICLIVVELVQK